MGDQTIADQNRQGEVWQVMGEMGATLRKCKGFSHAQYSSAEPVPGISAVDLGIKETCPLP